MSATKILWGQILAVISIVLLCVWGATEWVAWRLAFQPELGQPWFKLLGFPFYYPPAFFWWWYGYDAYARSIFIEGAYIAASGGLITDIVDGKLRTTLYLVVPPSDINRTKPLIRLILNQVGRRLTEDLQAKAGRHRLLLMLDEFPALGRLDFFESALAFMAGYGLKSFLIAQSLNQIEKAYGANNSILDNCHVRVSFATNDERTAKRVSDALGTATEMKAMKNYAGSRLSPWLGHLMVSRSETARPLLTPGEVMQLPATDQIVMVAGTPPIRAKKARYFEDRRFQERILPPPTLTAPKQGRPDDWTALPVPPRPQIAEPKPAPESYDDDPTESERRRQPELNRVKPVEKKETIENEFEIGLNDDDEDDAARNSRMNRLMQGAARQASLDPADGMDL